MSRDDEVMSMNKNETTTKQLVKGSLIQKKRFSFYGPVRAKRDKKSVGLAIQENRLIARNLGTNGIFTGLEIKMEKALQNSKISYVPQYRYGIGTMDFFLPEGKIALFVDGGVWHADPRLYGAEDSLFFKFKSSRKEQKNVTAADVWKKDGIHNSYLQSQGYTVVRFWEREIDCEIDRCMQIIKSQIKMNKEPRIRVRGVE